MKKLIVFDMDGVLFDTNLIVQKLVLNQYPGLTAEMAKELLVGNFHEAIDNLSIEKIPETDEEIVIRKAKYAIEKSSAPMYDGAKELLQDLHNLGFTLVMNTSAHRSSAFPMLEKAGIKELFDMIGTADISKSKAEKFRIFSEHYNVLTSDMLFITDTLGDIREAEEAGVPTIAVSWGVHDHSFFNRMPLSNLIGIVDSMQELEEEISQRFEI